MVLGEEGADLKLGVTISGLSCIPFSRLRRYLTGRLLGGRCRGMVICIVVCIGGNKHGGGNGRSLSLPIVINSDNDPVRDSHNLCLETGFLVDVQMGVAGDY